MLTSVGRTVEAIEHFDQALQLKPDYFEPLNNLAWLLATREQAQGGDPVRAIGLVQRARELSGQDNARSLATLAVAYAAVGQFPDAVVTAEKALQLAQSSGQVPLANLVRAQLELYRAGRAYHEVPRSLRQSEP